MDKIVEVLLFADKDQSRELIHNVLEDLNTYQLKKVTFAINAEPTSFQNEYGEEHTYIELINNNISNLIESRFKSSNTDYVLMINSSNYFSTDFKSLITASLNKSAMALKLVEDNSNSEEELYINEDYSINLTKTSDYKEAYLDAGIYCFNRETYKQLDGKSFAISDLIDEGHLLGVPCGGKSGDSLSKNWINSKPKPCLFLDRDGIIIEDTGYPHKPDQLKYLDEIIPLIKKVKENDWLVIVLTNQAGIAKGIFSEEDYFLCTQEIEDWFLKNNVEIDEWFFCPFHKDGNVKEYSFASLYRKPHPGLLLQAMSEFKIDVSSSIMIGDKVSDKLKHPTITTHLIKGKYDLGSENSFEDHNDLIENLFEN